MTVRTAKEASSRRNQQQREQIMGGNMMGGGRNVTANTETRQQVTAMIPKVDIKAGTGTQR